MSASLNKVMIIGNLGRDPEVRYLPSGDAVANIAVATAFKFKDRNTGELHETTEWHRVAFFGRLAEVVGQYLKKGASVFVEGRLQTRKYTDKDGAERYTTDIIAEQMQMLGVRPGDNGAQGAAQSDGGEAAAVPAEHGAAAAAAPKGRGRKNGGKQAAQAAQGEQAAVAPVDGVPF